MQFFKRVDQAHRMVGYQLIPNRSGFSELLSDSFFDGQLIGNKAVAKYWIEENDVHRAPVLGSNISTSRSFLGPQNLLVRDETRQLTHVIVPEENRLSISTLRENQTFEKRELFIGFTQRSHISLRKFDGKPFVLHISEINGKLSIFLNNTLIESKTKNPDFPFMDFSQEPIGHVSTDLPPFGIISYKCRESGKLYIRKINKDGEIEPEKEINSPECVGGIDFGISKNKIVFRINAIQNNKILPMNAFSEDSGDTISEFFPLDLEELQLQEYIPASSSVFVDFSNNIHIPVYAVDERDFHLVDYVHDQFATIALVAPKNEYNYGTLVAFPKNPSIASNFGNGLTDGVGIIATVVSNGKILSANSQAGGINYPEPAFLNYDMPKLFTLKNTQCYTRGVVANNVSMDYLFIEADGLGTAISQNLFIETWDMPLPRPLIEARATNNQIHIQILKDAYFIAGKTTFDISNPAIEINDVSYVNERYAILECNSSQISGVIVSFRSKNLFYDHEGSTVVM